MSDIAQLGLQIDSRQATTASAALEKLAAAAGGASAATDKLAIATGKSETSVRAIQSAADRAGVSFGTMNARVDANSASHAKLATASATATQGIANLANAAAGTGGSGSSGGSLAKASDTSSTALDRLANTLTRRVLFAAAAKEVRDFASYVWGLNSAIAATADAAQRSSMASGTFQGNQTAAAYKGVSNTDFNSAMVAFNQQVDLAKNGVGDLKILLSANGKVVGDTATTFGTVADLVKNAGSEAQKFAILQSAGLPANAAFVKFMEQGRDAIKAQSDGATKLSAQQLADATRIDAKWQSGWVNFENWGKKAVVNVFDFMGNTVPTWFKTQAAGLYSLPKPGEDRNFVGGANPSGVVTSAPLAPVAKADPTVDITMQKALNAQLQQRLSLQTQLGGVDAIVAAKEAELRGATLNLVGPNTTLHDQLINLARAQAENTLVQNQATSGVFNLNLANKAAADTMKMWVSKSFLDPTSTEQMAAAQTVLAKNILAVSDAAKVAASNLPQLTQLGLDAGNVFKQIDTFGVSSMTPMTVGLADIEIGDVL
jgi:hypothetical protein